MRIFTESSIKVEKKGKRKSLLLYGKLEWTYYFRSPNSSDVDDIRCARVTFTFDGLPCEDLKVILNIINAGYGHKKDRLMSIPGLKIQVNEHVSRKIFTKACMQMIALAISEYLVVS